MSDPFSNTPGNRNIPYGVNIFAILGQIIGIVGFVLSWIPIFGIPIGHVLGILAIIFSAIGLARANRLLSGHSAATLGLILGIITFVFKSIPLINLI